MCFGATPLQTMRNKRHGIADPTPPATPKAAKSAPEGRGSPNHQNLRGSFTTATPFRPNLRTRRGRQRRCAIAPAWHPCRAYCRCPWAGAVLSKQKAVKVQLHEYAENYGWHQWKARLQLQQLRRGYGPAATTLHGDGPHPARSCPECNLCRVQAKAASGHQLK